MTGLLDFLRARLDDDERVAREATPGDWEWGDGGDLGTSEDLVIYALGRDDPEVKVRETDATHIARHDPARVLREVAAKRAILDEYEVSKTAYEMFHDASSTYYHQGLHRAVAELAAVYADHPDFDPARGR